MKKSTIWFLTITMVVTFVGLLFTQFMYMEDMIRMRMEQFKEAVQRSLYTVSTLLEEDEAQEFLTEAIEEDLLSHHGDDMNSVIVQPQLSITRPDGSVTTFTYNSFKERVKALQDVPSWKDVSKMPPPMMIAYKNMQDMLRNSCIIPNS